MQNLEKASPGIFIDLGGVQRRFSYSMWSIGQIKRLTGRNPMKGEIDSNDPDDLAILVWAGLIPSDPTMDGPIIKSETPGQPGKPSENVVESIEQVQRWMSFDRLIEIAETVKMAFNASTPEPGKKK